MTSSTTTISSQSSLPNGVWRASDQDSVSLRTSCTGYSTLNEWLPSAGWPLGSLIEILTAAPGSGELELIAPACTQLISKRPIVLLNPPGVPNTAIWQQWQISSDRLWWLAPKTLSDSWWSAETVLRSQAFAALLAWLDPIDDHALRRLHACAQSSQTLVFVFRPETAAQHFSPCPLRLLLRPDPDGTLSITLLKSKGRKPAAPIVLAPRSTRHTKLGETSRVDGYRALALAR